MSVPRVLVFGYNAWDVLVPAPHWPARDAKCPVEVVREGGGGPGATAAVALARLGARVRFVSAWGDDRVAAAHRDDLVASGIDLAGGEVHSGHASPRAVILVDPADGARTIFWSRGGLPAWAPERVDPAWLENVDLLYCDGHDPAAAAVLARAARSRHLPVIVDAGSVRPGAAELVAAATDVIGSEHFARELSGRTDPLAALADLAARGPARVGMTCGERGVVVLAAGRPVHVPAFAVDAVDSTGAGDAFHAGYAWARVTGREFLDAVAYGAAVAALKCRGWGGRSALPDAAAVEVLLAGGTRRPDRPPFMP